MTPTHKPTCSPPPQLGMLCFFTLYPYHTVYDCEGSQAVAVFPQETKGLIYL